MRHYLISLILLFPCAAQVTFDYQVASRVHDTVDGYLGKALEAGKVALSVINQGDVNMSDAFSAGPRILFPSLYVYGEYLPIWQVGLETDLETGSYSVNKPIGPNKTMTWIEYRYNHKSGKVLLPTGASKLYNVKQRTWYAEAKARNLNYPANQSSWSSIFFSQGLGKGSPIMTCGIPINNITLNGHYYKGFAGVVAVSTRLTDISYYLKNTFSSSNYKVFIIELSSLNLIGNSWDFPISNNANLILATTCSDPIISGATSLLRDKKWTSDLIIMGEHYVQSQLYSDTIPGVEWYIIVVLPAIVEKDHVGPESNMYIVAIIISSIGIAVSSICLCITLYYRKSSMFKMIKPLFVITSLIGCIILSVSGLQFLNENSYVNCTIRPYLFNIGFTIAFTPMLIKSWLVHQLFNKNMMSKKKESHPVIYLSYILFFVLIDIIIMGITLYANGDLTMPVTKIMRTSNGAFAELTYCGYHYDNSIMLSELVYKSVLIAAACYLSFLTRNVVGAVAGSKALLAIVYNTAFTGILAMGVSNAINDIESKAILYIGVITECVVVCATFLVLPALYHVLITGDKAASKMVIDDIFDKGRSQSIEKEKGLPQSMSTTTTQQQPLMPSSNRGLSFKSMKSARGGSNADNKVRPISGEKDSDAV